MPRSHQLFDTSCCRDGGRQRACWQSAATIGVSRTSCTGSSTSSSTRTAPATARTTDRRTSPFCASWHSILSARIRAPRPYAAKSNAQGGTMPSSPLCSPKCDSPARSGAHLGTSPALVRSAKGRIAKTSYCSRCLSDCPCAVFLDKSAGRDSGPCERTFVHSTRSSFELALDVTEDEISPPRHDGDVNTGLAVGFF